MRHINGLYTQRFNRIHSCDGQLFRGRYKCILVDAESYLLELVRYIHRNPLEAGLVDQLGKYPWSSHKGYLSDAKKWEWLSKNFVLSMFSDHVSERGRKYRAFVSKDTPEEINSILANARWPSLMGSDNFIDRVKGRFFNERRHEEIPEWRLLAPDVDRLKAAVCSAYGVVSMDDLNISRRGVSNEPRNVAIYLMRRLRGDSLAGIGREFNIRKYSSVSTVIARMKDRISEDVKLRRRVLALEKMLKMSQEQT